MDVLPLRRSSPARRGSAPTEPLRDAPEPLREAPEPVGAASAPGKDALPGLDVVRAGAALCVVWLHSAVPYLRHPMPGLVWSVQDRHSDFADVSFWWIELFIMPLFLMIAGFLAWRSLQRKGGAMLVRDRARRLLAPLLFGVLVILPLDLHCWVLGWVCEGWVPAVKLRSFKFDGEIDRHLWGLSHLWFLQYLFTYVVLLAAWPSLRRFVSPLEAILRRPSFGLPLMFFLAAGTLAVAPEVVWGFQHAFLPVPSKWLYSGLFFLLGVWLSAHDSSLRGLASLGPRLSGAAVTLSVAAVTLGRWHLAGGDSQLAQSLLAVLTCAAAAALTLAITGLAVRRRTDVSRSVKYLAAASFWIYLVHHPLLGLVHIDLQWLWPHGSSAVKMGIAFVVASGMSLLSYEGLVRKTALGRWLGFSWQIPTETASPQNGPGEAVAPMRTAA